MFAERNGVAQALLVVIILALVAAGVGGYLAISQNAPSSPTSTTTSTPTSTMSSTTTSTSTPAQTSTTTASSDTGLLEVVFIDVGQGDSIYVRTPGGSDVLIDGGSASEGSSVVSFLRAKGVDDIELLVATHPDEDHIGGLPAVLSAFDVGMVWESGFVKDTQAYSNYKDAVTAEACPVEQPRRGESADIDPYLDVAVLNPPEPLYPASNQNSIVLYVKYGSVSFLFTGDIDSAVEGDIIESGASLASDVLKVAHHGSLYSSSTGFLAAAQPVISVISVGANDYGHPAASTLEGLAAVGSEIYRTDTRGSIAVTSDGFYYNVST